MASCIAPICELVHNPDKHSIVIHSVHLQQPDLNSQLAASFQQHRLDPEVRRSHFFHGRYENIYMTAAQVPALTTLLRIAQQHALALVPAQALKSGCWFNAMPPGAVTTRHNHDDDDELLSAVYYLHTPADSGDLILHHSVPPTRISPVAGQLIFFAPHIDHEVTCNNSNEERLSIGINFGPAHEN